MEQANANVTDANIRNAAATLRILADSTAVPSERYGKYIGMAAHLERLADYRAEQRREEQRDEQVIPIPAEAMNNEAMMTVIEHVHGMAEDANE